LQPCIHLAQGSNAIKQELGAAGGRRGRGGSLAPERNAPANRARWRGGL